MGIFRKLTGRRKKNKAFPPTADSSSISPAEALSVETSHTLDIDADVPKRPQHIRALPQPSSVSEKDIECARKESVSSTSSQHRRTRSRSNDRPRNSRITNTSNEAQDPTSQRPPNKSSTDSKDESSSHRRSGPIELIEKDKAAGHNESWNGNHDSKSRNFRFGFRNQTSTSKIQNSGSYDSEDEATTTTSATTASMSAHQLKKRGKKSQAQLAAQAANVKESRISTNRETRDPATSKANRGRIKVSAEEAARIRAANKETERIAKAAAALDSRGNEYFERGYYDKAMDAYSRALKLKRRTFHSMLEEADDFLGETDDAKKMEQKDEPTDPKLLVSMATSINNIGYLRQRAGEATPDETMAAYKKSLRIKRKILGNDSLSVGKTLNNIGSVYYLKRDFENALPAYEEALAIMQANLGETHTDVATVVSNMGDVNLALKNKEQALSRYRVALDIRWNTFGEKDPRTARLLEKIARIEVGDKMPTPRGTKVQRQYYDWDESELYDLDLRPVSLELRLLKDQVKEDIEAVDVLEKKIAVGMVRDKVKIVRGMRELIEAQERNHGSMNGISACFSNDSSNRDESNNDYEDLLNSPGMIPAMTGGQYNEFSESTEKFRSDAKTRVHERLAKLRSEKGMDPGGPLALPLVNKPTEALITEEKAMSVSEQGPSEFLKSTLISTGQVPSRAALSSMKPEEIKGKAADVESALKLKKGIDNLRSNPTDNGKIKETIETGPSQALEMAKDIPERDGTTETDVEAPLAFCHLEDQSSVVKGMSGNKEVESFFKNLIQKPTEIHGTRKVMHTSWLGEQALESKVQEVDSSLDSYENLSAPKLVHSTWLGEIES